MAVLIYIAKEKEKIHFQDYLDILCNPVEVTISPSSGPCQGLPGIPGYCRSPLICGYLQDTKDFMLVLWERLIYRVVSNHILSGPYLSIRDSKVIWFQGIKARLWVQVKALLSL